MHPRNKKLTIPNWIKTATKTEFKPDIDGDDFSGLMKCYKWLEENGYDYGSTAANCPSAVCISSKVSDCDCIPKWYNLDKEDVEDYIDGLIMHNRNESAFLYLKAV